MKKHILSKYSKEYSKRVPQPWTAGSTRETRAMEDSDPDQFMPEPAIIAEAVKNSDSTELILEPTVITKTMEVSDPDEFTLQASTMESFPKKIFSPNGFCGKAMPNYHREDFDSILLI